MQNVCFEILWFRNVVEVVTTFRNMCFAYALEFQVEKNGDSFLDRIC